jgi:rubrerythrin
MDKNSPVDEILEPLKIALRLEHEGKKFFQDAAKRCQGKLPRQTFQFLADEEDKHIAHIESFYRSLIDSENAAPPPVDDSATNDRFVTMVKRMEALKDEIKPTASDVEAYEYAIKFENGAEEFYAEQAARSEKPHIREFYEWLIREEERHAVFLTDCVKFAQDPAAWFAGRSDRD